MHGRFPLWEASEEGKKREAFNKDSVMAKWQLSTHFNRIYTRQIEKENLDIRNEQLRRQMHPACELKLESSPPPSPDPWADSDVGEAGSDPFESLPVPDEAVTRRRRWHPVQEPDVQMNL